MAGDESSLKTNIENAGGIKFADFLAEHQVVLPPSMTGIDKLIGGDGEEEVAVIHDSGQLATENVGRVFDEKYATVEAGNFPPAKDLIVTDVKIEFKPKQEVVERHNFEKSAMAVPKEDARVGRSAAVVDYIPLWGITSICGGRSEMEDAGAVVPRLVEIPPEMLGAVSNGALVGHFFGVYDGHGGSQVANYCSKRIHMALVEEMEMAKSSFHDTTALGGPGRGHLERAFSGCFQKVDAEVGAVSRGVDGSRTHIDTVIPNTAGSTAVISLICSTHIIIANCGDSRAVLYRGKEPLPLSVDHKPSRPDERERIEAAGGKVIYWEGHRVCGVLAVSRSIGDRYLKPSISPDPEVVLLPRAKEDECLILASDGLWDVMTNGEACDMARKRILLWHKKNGDSLHGCERGEGVDPAAQAAADYLTRIAIQKGSRDNITIIVVDLKAQRKFKKKTGPDALSFDTSKSS